MFKLKSHNRYDDNVLANDMETLYERYGNDMDLPNEIAKGG